MKKRAQSCVPLLGIAIVASCMACLVDTPAIAADNLSLILSRTSQQVSDFLQQFSNVRCTERVEQERLGPSDKAEVKDDSTYDYLIILSNEGGELSLDESRLAIHGAKPDKKNRPMMVTNGFATLFLIFHPYYAGSFQFSLLGDETVEGRVLSKVAFQHIRGTRSVAALSLAGREYPLELSGTAWIDPESGTITRIVAGIGNSMDDVGLKSLQTEIEYAPVPFRGEKETYWYPQRATVDVQTSRQHWRNTHEFSAYEQFSVSTEQVANK